MACNQSTSFCIDHEWEELLRGLRMNVPDDWWPGFTGHQLNGGVIAPVDFEIDRNNYFQLEPDKERGAFYAMRYNAVVCFADETHHSFSSFCLPAHALSNPAQEVVVVKTVNNDDNNDDDDKYVTPPPAAHNIQRCLNQQTTINPDLSAFGEEGMADGGPVPRRGRGAAPTPDTARYTMMDDCNDWTKISAANSGRRIDPIPYTGLKNSLVSICVTMRWRG